MTDQEPTPMRTDGADVVDGPRTGECGWCGLAVATTRLSELDVTREPCPEPSIDVCESCDPRTEVPLPCL